MSLTVDWSVSMDPTTPAYYDPDPFDFPPCPSRLFPTNGLDVGPRCCTVNHFETGTFLHGTTVAGHPDDWDDDEAIDSRARYLASRGPRCSECDGVVETRGLCGYHSHVVLAADDIEMEDVA